MFRVLLVDDEALALAALEHGFPWSEYGFTEVLSTISSIQALQILKERRIDAAFVDIRMPDINGIELLARAQALALSTCFVIVSGYSDFSYAQAAIRHNVMDYCLKPIQPEEVPGILEKLRSRVIETRTAEDPAYAARLLSDAAFCQERLSHMEAADAADGEMALLDIASPELLGLLAQADALSPQELLLFSEGNALLVWTHPPEPGQMDAFLSRNEDRAHFIIDTAPPTATGFQNALKRVRAERQNRLCEGNGILRFSPISAGMADCFTQLLAYVDAHYNQELTLQSLACQFSVNYTYLSQQFKRSMKKSFSEYLTSVRLQAACNLLLDTQMRVVAIAEQVGYNDYHYFNNVFKRQFSVTPLQYRQSFEKEPDR